MNNKFELAQIFVFHLFLIIYSVTFSVREFPLVIAILLILVAVMCICEYKIAHILPTPMMFWLTFWLAIIVIGRVDFHVYSFNSVWEDRLHYTVVISTWVFYVCYIISKNVKIVFEKNKSVLIYKDITYHTLSSFVLTVLAIMIIFYFINIQYTGNIPQFSENVDYYRRSFVITPFFSIINILRIVYAVIPIAIVAEKRSYIKRWIIVLSLLVAILELLTGWRTYTFQEIIMIMTSTLLLSNVQFKKERKKNIRLIILFIAIAIAVISYVAISRAGKHGSIKELASYVIKNIYLYFAPSFLNFQSAMKEIIPIGYPLYTTEALWGLFVSGEQIPEFENINQNIGAFNVSTYMLQPYADFGIIGVVIWSAIIAALAGRFISRIKTNKSILNIAILGIINITVFNLHNGFFIRSSSVIVWIIIITVVNTKCYNREEN